MRRLIIYNNRGGFSTVLDAFLKVAEEQFDNIRVFFPHKFAKCDYNVNNHITFTKCNLLNYAYSFYKSISLLMSNDIKADFAQAKKKGNLNLRYIKRYYSDIIIAGSLYAASLNELRMNRDNLYLLSTWYDYNATALAIAKMNFPKYVCSSYVHSYEVDFRKCIYSGLLQDRFKEKYIDNICFISENIMREYIDLNKDILKNTDKYVPLHFGSEKKQPGRSVASNDGIFRILSCSSINPIKRLNLIIEALSLYKGSVPVEWTHLGSGNKQEEIIALAEQLKDVPNINVRFLGRVSNDEVHRYYISNPIDLFINVSVSEGLPVSIMEAMSYGVPAIATDVGGNSEIVTEDTGYLVPAGVSSDILSEVLSSVVLTNDVFKKRDNAYTMWKKNYQIKVNVNKMIAIMVQKR